MATIQTSNLSPMQLGRLNIALDKRYRFDGVVMTLREKIEASEGVKREWDGMADWSRTKFNRMSGAEQRAYEAKLKARRYYTVDGTVVPKIVHDAVVGTIVPPSFA
jgi:hypothetical protein